MFYKYIDGHKVSFPVPTSHDTLPTAYARAARRKFKLTAEDGVTDQQFYDNT
ncbi:hypothetical protein [Gemmata obscuriglobus]|nr:hypothetical protein [Gemmata obscuriglobus]